MIRTRIVSIGTAILLSGGLQAQTQQRLNINEATVFLSGAELTSTARISLQKGDNEVLFTNVAGDVNSQSLNVKATGNVVVTSATFQNNYLATEALSPRAKAIKDSIELLTEDKATMQIKLDVVNAELGIMRVSRNDSARTVAEITKMLDLTAARMEGYRVQQHKEQALIKKADEHIARLNKQLDEESKKEFQPGGQLLVKFHVAEAISSDITIDYIVPHAGWTPTYDVMADNVSSPVKLYYKANIYQNSGVKWDNVRLSLSTGNPQEGVQAPMLDPWYLAFYAPQNRLYKNSLISNYGYNAPAAAPTARYGLHNQFQSRFDADSNESTTTINDYVAVDNAGINTSFDIDLPYTIPSDGQQHLVAIKKYDVPATYRYYAVPKMDKDAFLQAQITNWEDLNLLPGTTNVFYEGTYVGQGTIDVRNVKDTMTISLGRDKKIVVKRERDVKKHSVKTIGTNERETFAYTITIRNTRKENIHLVVQDQVPVSNDASIVIEDKDTPDAELTETTGALKWTIQLGANESKKLTLGYTVKYPKGQTIENLR